MIVVQICSFVFQKHIHNSWMPIPACVLKRSPLSFALDVWICVFLKKQVVYHTFVPYGARKMKRRQLIVSKAIQVNDNILRQFDARTTVNLISCSLVLLLLVFLTPLHVTQLGFVYLILVNKPYDFLLLASIANHVADFVNDHHVTKLLVTCCCWDSLNRLWFNWGAKGWEMVNSSCLWSG
jgi:hypothetical protein